MKFDEISEPKASHSAKWSDHGGRPTPSPPTPQPNPKLHHSLVLSLCSCMEQSMLKLLSKLRSRSTSGSISIFMWSCSSMAQVTYNARRGKWQQEKVNFLSTYLQTSTDPSLRNALRQAGEVIKIVHMEIIRWNLLKLREIRKLRTRPCTMGHQR